MKKFIFGPAVAIPALFLPVPILAEALAPNIKRIFDECFEVTEQHVQSANEIVEKQTSIGKITIKRDTRSCSVVSFTDSIVEQNKSEIALKSQVFLAELLDWMNNKKNQFERAIVLAAEKDKPVLLACINRNWQVVAAGTIIKNLGNEAVEKDPIWNDKLASAASANFFADGPKGKSCDPKS